MPDRDRLAVFGPEDIDLLSKVLQMDPELRVVALVGQRVRKGGVVYPIERFEEFLGLLEDEGRLEMGTHIIDGASIQRYMPDTYFPIVSEEELLSRAYLALVACKEESISRTNRRENRTITDAPVLAFFGDQTEDE